MFYGKYTYILRRSILIPRHSQPTKASMKQPCSLLNSQFWWLKPHFWWLKPHLLQIQLRVFVVMTCYQPNWHMLTVYVNTCPPTYIYIYRIIEICIYINMGVCACICKNILTYVNHLFCYCNSNPWPWRKKHVAARWPWAEPSAGSPPARYSRWCQGSRPYPRSSGAADGIWMG